MKAVPAVVAATEVHPTTANTRMAVADAVHKYKVRGFWNENTRGSVECRLKDWRTQNDFNSPKLSSLNRGIVGNSREQRAFKVAIRINGC